MHAFTALSLGICFFFGRSPKASAALTINVDISEETGAFSIYVNARRWFGSGETFLRAGGGRHSSADGSLLLGAVERSVGSDSLGRFFSTEMHWETSSGSGSGAGVPMVTSLRQYETCVVFGQSFPEGVSGTSAGDADELVSGFPTFKIAEEDEPVGYSHWISWYWLNQSTDPTDRRRLLEAKGFDSPQLGQWGPGSVLFGGIGGSGVTAVFNDDASIAAVISPFDSFMAASQASPSPGLRSMGVMGNVTEIPVGYAMSSIVYFGEGINAAVRAWGETMLQSYNKPSLQSSGYVAADISLSYLGYTTDNGAYYYYNTVPGKNYQDTIMDIKAYADELQLPYRYILLDSW
jgi:hypothetical protein